MEEHLAWRKKNHLDFKDLPRLMTRVNMCMCVKFFLMPLIRESRIQTSLKNKLSLIKNTFYNRACYFGPHDPAALLTMSLILQS